MKKIILLLILINGVVIGQSISLFDMTHRVFRK